MFSLHDILIRIAGIQIKLTSPLSAAELGIEERLGPFFAADAAERPLARVALRWQESELPPVPRGELIYDPGSIWTMHRDGTDWYAALTCQSENRTAQPQAVLCANPNWDNLTLTEHRSGPQWQSLLNIGAGELILRTASSSAADWSFTPLAWMTTAQALSSSGILAQAKALSWNCGMTNRA